jgi:pyruvate-formate lyase-activating enzyme
MLHYGECKPVLQFLNEERIVLNEERIAKVRRTRHSQPWVVRSTLETGWGQEMPASGLQPQPDVEVEARGQFLTFVVPASGGCNLGCSFCLIRQRDEIAGDPLRPEHFARFIREAAERSPIFAVSIQGYEPLLPAALPYTQAVLATGNLLSLPTAMVTNGVLLADALDLLTVLVPSKIAISLDSASADIHDRIRGMPGAWSSTVAGIKRAIQELNPRTRLTVSSVLLPGKRHHLDGMPEHLRDIGIDRWIVNPLLRVGRERVGGPIGNCESLFDDFLVLQGAADRANVLLTIDDEFNHLGHGLASVRRPELRSLHVRTLPRNVEIFRLAPGGQCSTGEAILKRLPPGALRWRPGMIHAGDFLESVSESTNLPTNQTRTARQ